MLITGSARGIGASLAERLVERGAVVALCGLESGLLAEVSRRCNGAPWWSCDVTNRTQLAEVVGNVVDRFGGLDVVVANAGVAGQLPLVGGNPEILEQTLAVNTIGVYNTMWAAAKHVSHPEGYFLVISSLAAAVHLPLLGAYSASKAASEALGNTLRIELRPSGARVGVAYFAELDTEMTSRGFGTDAAKVLTGGGALTRSTPLKVGIDALERGIMRRSRHIVAPWWVSLALTLRPVLPQLVEPIAQRKLATALEIARQEVVELTTPQPPLSSGEREK